MFGPVFSMGGDPEVERTYARVRHAILEVVQKAQGVTGGRWEGPGSSQVSNSRSISPQTMIPDIMRVVTRTIAQSADTDPDIRAQLVGAWVHNDVPSEDLNLYLLGVVGAIEHLLARPSPACREMASVMGDSQHDSLGNQHVMNKRWPDAESEFRLALEMARLSPDGREVNALVKVAEMNRLQGRHPEAKRLFREALYRSDRLDPGAAFADLAKQLGTDVRAKMADCLMS